MYIIRVFDLYILIFKGNQQSPEIFVPDQDDPKKFPKIPSDLLKKWSSSQNSEDQQSNTEQVEQNSAETVLNINKLNSAYFVFNNFEVKKNTLPLTRILQK